MSENENGDGATARRIGRPSRYGVAAVRYTLLLPPETLAAWVAAHGRGGARRAMADAVIQFAPAPLPE